MGSSYHPAAAHRQRGIHATAGLAIPFARHQVARAVQETPITPIERLRAAVADRYTIERELGRGAMATVYLARDAKHDRWVALKVMHAELAAALGTARFLQEIRIAAQLQHPHVLALFDSGEAGNHLYYVMPYVEGESLRSRLARERQLPLDEAIALTRAIAGALDYAHRHHVVHRDIKPENILLQDGHPLVADFGVALAVTRAGGARLTETGLSLGTPQYMSPEQALADAQIDGRSDQYSLACLFYEMLTGEPPYRGISAQAVIARHLADPVPHVRTVRSVPEHVERAITRGLAKAPADRFPSVAAFGDALAGHGEPPAHSGRGGARRVIGAAVGVAVLLAIAAVGWSRVQHGGAGGRAIRSLAVLPLENVGGDPHNEYFSDGISDGLLTALSSVPGLRVASRTSSFLFRGANATDVRDIGRRLDVAAVLEGAVQREGSRLRVHTSLVDAGNGLTLWSERYERDGQDVFKVEDEISQAVVRALTPTLTGEPVAHLARGGTDNLDAYDAYLRARYVFNRFTEPDLRESIRLYQQALDKDPRYARAWAGIAESWAYLADDYVAPRDAEPNVKAAALRALAFDSTVAEAHAALGTELYEYEWKFDSGGRELRRALALAPNLFLAQFSYHGYLLATGHPDSALAVLTRAQALDPLSVLDALILGRFFGIVGRYDRAADSYRHALELAPNTVPALIGLGESLLAEGQTTAADSVLRIAHGLVPPAMDYLFASAEASEGHRAVALRLVGELERLAQTRYVRPEEIAAVYAHLGDADHAFQWLDSAYAARSSYVLALKVDRTWAPLRSDPRFAALAQRIGLP